MWHTAKQALKEASGLDDQILHVGIGFAIFVVLLVILRRPWLSFWCLAVIQIANEMLDLLEDVTGTGIIGAGYDTALTLAGPLLMAAAVDLLMRRRRYSRSPPTS